MSRSQETQAFNTASDENKQTFQNAQNSYNSAQEDINNYAANLAEYAAKNPYVAGGEFQTAQNTQLANTADASARAAGGQLQMTAKRTGQNPAGAIAATEDMEQQNERNLAGQEATATEQRLGAEAGYNTEALKASEVPAQLEAGLAGQQGNMSSNELSDMTNAGKTPGFWDEFGNAFAQGLGSGISYSKGGVTV